MPPKPFKLGFGVEFELLVRPKPALYKRLAKSSFNHKVDSAAAPDKKPSDEKKQKTDEANKAIAKNRTALHTAIAEELSGNGIPTNVEDSLSDVTSHESEVLYLDWGVVDENALEERPGFCKFPSRL
jgi:hypothetical protein